MRGLCGARQIIGLGAALALVAAAAACSGAGPDKAGGRQAAKPHVLTLANPNGNVDELQAFADEVARASGGKLRIEFRNQWRKGETGYEAGLIKDVEEGKADLGSVGSRAWDAVGIASFDALGAPFLINSYALEEKVVESRIPGEMMRSLSSLGLVGLGVLPGPLRKPLAVERALVTPSDFRGVKIGITESRVARETLHALGANARALRAGGSITGLDAVELQIATIYPNNYDLHAKYLAANVDLWPRPLVLFMSKKRFAQLDPSERALLRRASKEAISATLATVRALEQNATTGLCRRGLNIVSATSAELTQLRRAVAPVYAKLDRQRVTRSFIASISEMRAKLAEPPAFPSCSSGSPSSPGVIPNGSYTVTITREDTRRAGLSPQDQLSEKRFRLVLSSGNFIMYELRPGGRADVGFAGTYSVYRGHISVNGDNGDRLSAGWSFDGKRLRFRSVSLQGSPGANPYTVVWGSHPWVKVG
jgi:TRAP-type transport system periplasmic protein